MPHPISIRRSILLPFIILFYFDMEDKPDNFLKKRQVWHLSLEQTWADTSAGSSAKDDPAEVSAPDKGILHIHNTVLWTFITAYINEY